jgi:hypothetical protein
MIRNGKIARLPKAVQEQLNRRLSDNETGKNLVVWLNSLPEVQAVIAAEFGGRPIREQNLSEWRKGGFRDWLRQQERFDLLRQMRSGASDLGELMNGGDFHRQMSLLLTTDLALALREAAEQITDPGERARCVAQLAGRIAQARREESNATRVDVIRQRWERELALAEEHKLSGSRFMPSQALLLQRLYIDSFSDGVGRELALELDAAGQSPSKTPASSGGKPPYPAQSDLLRPDSEATESRQTVPTTN